MSSPDRPWRAASFGGCPASGAVTWARVKVVVVFGDGASSPGLGEADDHDGGDGREPDDDEPLAHRPQLARTVSGVRYTVLVSVGLRLSEVSRR